MLQEMYTGLPGFNCFKLFILESHPPTIQGLCYGDRDQTSQECLRKLNLDQQEEWEEWALAQCKSDISVRHVEKVERGISRNCDFLS